MDHGKLGITIGDDYVTTIEIRKPPNNHIDIDIVDGLIETLNDLDEDPRCRAIVLCSEGKHFCAGADFRRDGSTEAEGIGNRSVYDEAEKLFATRTPIVAAVQGAAVGAGLGLAMVADFRVAAPEARFSANFARLGFHHGFVLSATLPRAIGHQRALEMLYTGQRLKGDEALAIGLADRLAPLAQVREVAHQLAVEIATSAPLAVESIRQTMRGDLTDLVRTVKEREMGEQAWLRTTNDWVEGVAAMAERRTPNFTRS